MGHYHKKQRVGSHLFVKFQNLATGFALYLLLAITLSIYWPGLNSAFIFDDFPNLQGLKLVGAYADSTGVWRYLLEGASSPLGRPLSLLSFLLNDTRWPAPPWSFKYTNLLLHLLNGVLVFWLVLVLARLSGLQSWRIHATAILASTFWLVHPFHVSTVLYVIQRMTELATLFMLAGLLAYTHGRLLVADQPRLGYLWMSLGIVLGGVLAILSKEIGILLPLYALVVEFTLIRSASIATPARWWVWSAVFLFLPLLLLTGFFIYNFEHYLFVYQLRDFTWYERLLTQPRVLMDYLSHIVLPRRAGTGVLHDDYIASRDLFESGTLLATLAVMSMLASAVAFRKKYAVLSFGILWFFAGHLLESGIAPLELYFEHRNYLPMMGPLFAVAYYVINAKNRHRNVLVTLSLMFIVLSATITLQQAQLTANTLFHAITLATEHPRSTRAHQEAARQWVFAGNLDMAEGHLREILAHHPNSSAAHMELIQLGCLRSDPPLPATEMKEYIKNIHQGGRDTAAANSLTSIIWLYSKNRCKMVSIGDLVHLVDALIDNPSFFLKDDLAKLYYIKSSIHELDKDLNQTILALQRAYGYRPSVDVALAEAKHLVSGGLLDDALLALHKARRADRSKIPGLRLRKNDIDKFHQAILKFKGNKGN